ncbi:unnamed protein product [Microthlaspi erraticum]|uniref:Uncharacterized protein n=1 Tax=Microthlaspi erraticum TaxID=1685480 RepID=A0A6D2II96_9BRAS|nr:unnamed protein product [Microthlaspi erraticum]
MRFVERSGRTGDDAFLVGRCGRAWYTDRGKREGRTRDKASRFTQRGRAQHIVVGLEWVDHGRMLSRSVCALGRALGGINVVFCAGRSWEDSSSVGRCVRSWALLRGFRRLDQSSLNRSLLRFYSSK